jgi:hypothetical protein
MRVRPASANTDLFACFEGPIEPGQEGVAIEALGAAVRAAEIGAVDRPYVLRQLLGFMQQPGPLCEMGWRSVIGLISRTEADADLRGAAARGALPIAAEALAVLELAPAALELIATICEHSPDFLDAAAAEGAARAIASSQGLLELPESTLALSFLTVRAGDESLVPGLLSCIRDQLASGSAVSDRFRSLALLIQTYDLRWALVELRDMLKVCVERQQALALWPMATAIQRWPSEAAFLIEDALSLVGGLPTIRDPWERGAVAEISAKFLLLILESYPPDDLRDWLASAQRVIDAVKTCAEPELAAAFLARITELYGI